MIKKLRRLKRLRAIIFVLIFMNLGLGYANFTDAASYNVQFVYFCATDACSGSYNAGSLDGYAHEIQSWYQDQVGSSFKLAPTIQVNGYHPAGYYANNTYGNLFDELNQRGLLSSNTKTIVMLGFHAFYACGTGAGVLGVTDPFTPLCYSSKSAYMAHELGHTLLSGTNADHLLDGTLMDEIACHSGRALPACNLNSGQANQIADSPWFKAQQISIQGYKLVEGPNGANQFISPAADQTVTINGAFGNNSQPYYFAPEEGGNYTMHVTTPAGYRAGYTLCHNGIDCHDSPPIAGDTVTIQNGTGVYDLWWHFTPANQPAPQSAAKVDTSLNIRVRRNGKAASAQISSLRHTVGTCNTFSSSGKGKPFTVKGSRVCIGTQIGPPNGLFLVAPAKLDGVPFTKWTTSWTGSKSHANPNPSGGAIDCNNNRDRAGCFINIPFGSVTITAVYGKQ